MQDAWIHFIIVIFTQLFLFVICAYYVKIISEVPRILGLGVLIGIVVGIPFDLLAGKYFGLHSFTLGFGLPFLIINATVSYGLFTATILLMQNVRLPNFIIWNIILIALYEVTNHLFTVWTWGFALPAIEFVMILLVGYLTGAFLVAAISHTILGRRFFFIDNFSKK